MTHISEAVLHHGTGLIPVKLTETEFWFSILNNLGITEL